MDRLTDEDIESYGIDYEERAFVEDVECVHSEVQVHKYNNFMTEDEYMELVAHRESLPHEDNFNVQMFISCKRFASTIVQYQFLKLYLFLDIFLFCMYLSYSS